MADGNLIVVFVLIGGLWAVFLLPQLFASRRETPMNSTEEFDRWTNKLATVHTEPGENGVVRSGTLSRRRQILMVLTVAAVVSLVAALSLSSPRWLFVHIGIDAAVAWYVALLLQIKQRKAAVMLEPIVSEPVVAEVADEFSPVKILASG